MKCLFHFVLLALSCSLISACDSTGKKYVAYSSDTEAYFMPRSYQNFEGEFTSQIVEVCREANIPFTWLLVVDKKHTEVHTFAEKIYPGRKGIDEFSLHAHFKWFIMDAPDDFSSFKEIERRMKWLEEAKMELVKSGMPMPRSFRYGAGDSNDRYYCIEDLIFLYDELGVRNFLFDPVRLPGVVGINSLEHQGNNVWTMDGDRDITLLSTCVYLDEELDSVLTAIDSRLKTADYAILGSHDYIEVVPEHLRKSLKHLNDNYTVEFVTIDRIGELVRQGKIKNID